MKTNKKNGININGINVNLGNIADLINEGKIINLLDIPWIALFDKANLLDSTVFGGYAIPHKEIETIIKQIVSDSVKIALIESIQKDCKKHLLPTNYLFNETDLQRCLTFLDNLKEDINDYEYYDLQAVKRREKPSIESKTLPKELDTQIFKAILNRAKKAGFVEENAERHEWNGQKNELAWFAVKVSEKLSLSNRENSNGTKQTNWQPFEILFGVPNLRGAYNDMQKTGSSPKKEKEIEKIING